MKEVIIDTYCGLSCYECEYKQKCNCQGCKSTNGHPFHDQCELAQCAVSKGKRFCGECENFPCDLLKRFSFDVEHGDNGERINNCRRQKSTLVENAREGLNTVSVCGHHCDYCFLQEWCGGCRSDYNCCSFATLFDNGVCPNVACANEKKLEGCFECPQLEKCEIGYYGRTEEFAAKATALFIRKYGQETYGNVLKKAVESGFAYAEDLDKSGSVENALHLLEAYIEK